MSKHHDSNALIARNICKYREMKGFSQGELARSLDVNRSYISTLERGSRNPSVRTLDRIAEALDIGLPELVAQSQYDRIQTGALPYTSGIVKKKRSEWEGRRWYHQRFDGSPYFMHMIAEAEVLTRREEKHGLSFDRHFCFYDDGKADWYIDLEEIDRVSERVLELSGKDRAFHEKLIAEYDPLESAFYEFCDRIGKTRLHELSNRELVGLHDEYLATILMRNSSSSIIDGFALGTDRMLEKRIREAYEKHPEVTKEIGFSDVFSTLTTPSHSSFVRDAELDLFRLIRVLRRNRSESRRLISEYRDRYFWIRNNYIDSYDLPVSYFEEEVARIESSETDIEEEIARIERIPAENVEKKRVLLKQLTLDETTAILLSITEDFTAWQDDRKKVTLFTAHYATLLLDEISRRTGVSTELLKYMTPREVSRIFVDTPSAALLESRRTSSVAYWDTDGHEILHGDIVKTLRDELLGSKTLKDVEDFRGMTASLGSGQGRARIIRSVKEVDRVRSGDVLVAVMTRPDYVPAMKKAAAIVTDEGGITSHAAIVSRELKIPCVIGTKIATQVLRDGDLVQVNANHGVVRILKRAD